MNHRNSVLRTPPQAAPVDRAGPSRARGADAGIEPAGIFDDIVGGIGKVASVALPVLGAFGI